MKTIERTCPPRSFGRIASVMLGALALSGAVVACAAPTEPEPSEPNEPTASQSEALANNGGGPGGGTTCDSRWQNCYIKCGVIYGQKNPTTQAQCEDLCDSIHTECSGSRAARALVPQPINVVQESVAP